MGCFTVACDAGASDENGYLCLLSCLQFSDFCFLFFADIIDFISFTILEKLALFQHWKSESLPHYDNQI